MFRIQHMKSLQTQEIFLYQTLNYSRKWSGWDKVTQRKSLNTNLTSITHNYFNYMSEFQTYLWLLLKRIGSMGVASVDVFHNSKQRDKTCWRAMSVCTAGAFPHTRQWILKCDVKKKKKEFWEPQRKKHLLGKKRHKHLDGLLISSIWFNKKKKSVWGVSEFVDIWSVSCFSPTQEVPVTHTEWLALARRQSVYSAADTAAAALFCTTWVSTQEPISSFGFWFLFPSSQQDGLQFVL